MSASMNAAFITGAQNNDSRGTKSLVNLNQGKSTEGFDEYFDPPLENKYECPICLLGLREPVQTECGHQFCRNCIVRSLRNSGNKCPVDNIPLSESGLFVDNFAKREMGSFTVWCRQHKERGCPWKGSLNDLEAHLKTCPYSDVTCPNKCGTVVQLKLIDEHMNICPKRKVPCDYCKKMIFFTEKKLHFKDCPKYKVQCPKCNEKITNEELINHREKFCPKEKIKCPLHFAGCKEEGFIPEINKHISANAVSHIYDMAKALKEVQSKVKDPATPINAPGLRGGELSGATYSGYADRDFESSINSVQDKLKLLENRLLDLEGRVTQGTYIWKIDNYEQCRTQAVNNAVSSIQSPPFYTDLYGYKMCLRMDLNGVDSGQGSNVSLFVHMMQGEWDDILEWPFTGRIIFAILDQGDNVELLRPIRKILVAKPNSLASKKPNTHCNDKGHGYVEFCQIDQLVQDQYVKNNSMFVSIRVIIDRDA